MTSCIYPDGFVRFKKQKTKTKNNNRPSLKICINKCASRAICTKLLRKQNLCLSRLLLLSQYCILRCAELFISSNLDFSILQSFKLPWVHTSHSNLICIKISFSAIPRGKTKMQTKMIYCSSIVLLIHSFGFLIFFFNAEFKSR